MNPKEETWNRNGFGSEETESQPAMAHGQDQLRHTQEATLKLPARRAGKHRKTC